MIIGLSVSVYAHGAQALANPASVKCIADGGTLSTVTDSSGGQQGMCQFPDGSTCEEWAYFRGECTSKKVSSLDQLPATCISAYDGCNNCSRTQGGAWACTLMACIDSYQPAVVCTKFSNGNKPVKNQPSWCSESSFTKMIRGHKGSRVRALQDFLIARGFLGGPNANDGVFGLGTQQAVKLFQKDQGLSQDGVFGKRSQDKACMVPIAWRQ